MSFHNPTHSASSESSWGWFTFTIALSQLVPTYCIPSMTFLFYRRTAQRLCNGMTMPLLRSWPSRKHSLTLLSHPKPDAPLISLQMPPTSCIVVRAVLQQYINHCWCPIAYFSKKLQSAETQYSTFDRELSAIYLAIKHFQHFVEGRTFHILTDHKSLIYAFAIHSDKHYHRQIHHLDYISQFTSDIQHRHVKGADNPAADALSCIGASDPVACSGFQGDGSSPTVRPRLCLSHTIPTHLSLKRRSHYLCQILEAYSDSTGKVCNP